MTESSETKTRSDMLAKEKISSLLMKMSMPAIIGMMVQALYNLVDTFFVSNFTGTHGLGGITIAFPIQMILIGIGISVGIGGASILSRRMGERDHDGASLALGNMLMLSVVMGVICLAVGFAFMTPLLKLFGATPELMQPAQDYIGVILLGGPFLIFSTVASSAARAEGNAKVAMFTLVIGGVLNCILDPIFIIDQATFFGQTFTLLGRGVRGAAEATVISILASCCFLFHYLLSGKSEVRLKPHHLMLRWSITREIFAVGTSDFARTAAMSGTSGIFNHILGGLGGAVPIATFGIMFRVMSFVFMPMIGIAQGAQPIIGFNFGARQFQRIRECFRLANTSATLLSIVGWIIFMAFPVQILRIFSSDPELLALGKNAMRGLALAFPLIGYQNIGSGLFQAIGKAVPAIFLAFSRQVLFLIPLVLIMSRLWGLWGVWLSFPASDVIAFAVTLVWVTREMKVLKRMESLPQPPLAP